MSCSIVTVSEIGGDLLSEMFEEEIGGGFVRVSVGLTRSGAQTAAETILRCGSDPVVLVMETGETDGWEIERRMERRMEHHGSALSSSSSGAPSAVVLAVPDLAICLSGDVGGILIRGSIPGDPSIRGIVERIELAVERARSVRDARGLEIREVPSSLREDLVLVGIVDDADFESLQTIVGEMWRSDWGRSPSRFHGVLAKFLRWLDSSGVFVERDRGRVGSPSADDSVDREGPSRRSQ